MTSRARRGAIANAKGETAELAVKLLYQHRGATLLAERMRNEGGEIDLIFRENNVIVFVEVKARKGHAPEVLSSRQMARIGQAALIWCAEHAPAADLRFDLATVDRHGQAEILQNAMHFDGL